MYIYITFAILVTCILVIFSLRPTRYSTSYSWLIAAVGGLLVWGSILAWQLNLPWRFSPSLWKPEGLFSTSPDFLADPVAWLFALSLATLAATVVLTFPAREPTNVRPSNLAGTLALTTLGIITILADNPLTLVLGWTAIDLTELINTQLASDSRSLSERSVISFAVRSMGTGLVLWASVTNAMTKQTFLFENTTPQTGIFLIMAVGLRLGVLPLHLTYRNEPALRRGFGTLLRMVTAATSLILLARLPASSIDPNIAPFLLILAVMAALYGGWMWLTATDEISGRPYWIIGMSSIALAASLRGNPVGAAAWGAALVLLGGISFLYSSRNTWFSRILGGISVLLLGLPFSLTASGWNGNLPWPYFLWPLFIIANLMLATGYVRHIISTGDSSFAELPVWAQSAYPAGLGLLALTTFLTGFWGWPGAFIIGAWIPATVLALLSGMVVFGAWRFNNLFNEKNNQNKPIHISRLGDLLEFLAKILWGGYRLTGRVFDLSASLLEGDGGLLWTILLLVLFFTIFRSR